MSRPGALWWACVLGALVLPAPVVGAQDKVPPAPEGAPDDPETGSVWYAWVEQDELSSILEVCTHVVGAHIEYDPAAFAGQEDRALRDRLGRIAVEGETTQWRIWARNHQAGRMHP